MLGSLLEPELLADILETLLHADETQRDLVVDLMSVLPRCDRFETALMFLEHSEKQRESIGAILRPLLKLTTICYRSYNNT
jgi:ACT domain-containing protein